MEPSKKTIHDLLAKIGSDLPTLTVSQIAEQTGKSERAIRTHLTRNGISVKNYDGKGNKAQAIKNQEAIANRLKPENSPTAKRAITNAKIFSSITAKSSTNLYETYSSIQEGEDDGFNFMAVVCGLTWVVVTIWGFSANGPAFFLFWLLISFGLFMAWGWSGASLAETYESRKVASLSPEEQDAYNNLKGNIDRSQKERMAGQELMYGTKTPNLICPHCQTKGEVRSKLAVEVTTTKVVPIIGNNIKTKKQVTQMHCDKCQTTWNV